MKPRTANDVEALAHNRAVNGAAFRAVFATPDAVTDLARLLQVSELLTPLTDQPAPLEPSIEMEFSFDDLSQVGENKVRDPKRREAMVNFLIQHGLLQAGRDKGAPTATPGSDTGTEYGIKTDAPDETKFDTKKSGDQNQPPDKP
jgi:hypothetical protein